MEYKRPDSTELLGIALDKEAMRELGFYVRMTEWHEGFQVCAFKTTDIRKGYVSRWHETESAATRECLLEVRKITQELEKEQQK